jgi:hypothetical protein
MEKNKLNIPIYNSIDEYLKHSNYIFKWGDYRFKMRWINRKIFGIYLEKK